MAQGRVEEKRDPNVEKSHRNKNNVDHVVGIHSLNPLRGVVVPELPVPPLMGSLVLDHRLSGSTGARRAGRRCLPCSATAGHGRRTPSCPVLPPAPSSHARRTPARPESPPPHLSRRRRRPPPQLQQVVDLRDLVGLRPRCRRGPRRPVGGSPAAGRRGPARSGAPRATFSSMPPPRSTWPARVISPVMARSPWTGRPVNADTSAAAIVTSTGASFPSSSSWSPCSLWFSSLPCFGVLVIDRLRSVSRRPFAWNRAGGSRLSPGWSASNGAAFARSRPFS